MSIEAPIDAYTPSQNGVSEAAPRTPLSIEFEKIKSLFGFIEPSRSELLTEQMQSADTHQFDLLIQSYIENYSTEHELTPHELSDVYPFRGILIGVSQLYYEYQYTHPGHEAPDRARDYQYKEYLRTVDEDMRFLDEQPNEHLENLLYEFGIKLPQFPHQKIVRFSTNIMHVLAKIDHNLGILPKDLK